MSIFSAFKKLFESTPTPAKSYPEQEYKGFIIAACPQSANGQYRVSAMISKTIADEVKQHHFIRSDTCASAEDAAELAVHKCKTFIDQMGDQIFE
ncbi:MULTISPECIES: HlyU family transcriptional regulator [unclassified Agarivorans]|uniref:HlyU family transcriptional regulator n=1 Tax=unclassified Agarivorans TaxID=2636026 RepID=UPI003D7CA852